MDNTFYFLRHGKTTIDSKVPISQWTLSAEGKEQAKKLANKGTFKDIDLIFSSTEKKSYQTAKPVADALGKEITQLEEIKELDRDKGNFMEPAEYEVAVKNCLEHLDESINNWEIATRALQRFSRKIEELDKEYENKKILIVGHGFTINLYFAKLLGLLDNVYKRLTTNDFADWGTVRNYIVIKDIAK